MNESGNGSMPIRKGWEKAAQAYKDGLGVHLQPVATHLAELLRPVLRFPVLDLACGPGTALKNVWNDAREGAGVCCDFSREMVDIAKRQVRGSSGVVADQDCLPFAQGAFKTVVSSMGTIFSSNPEQQIQEISRMLSQGGVYGFSAWGRAEECDLRGVSESVIAGWPHPYEGSIPSLESPYSAGRTDWIESVSRKAGFRIERIESGRLTFRFRDRHEAARALVGTGRYALLLQDLPDSPVFEKELLERASLAFSPHTDPVTGSVSLVNGYSIFVLVRK
ncbi:MAG: class I SAM-dependent methyltransferase [Leptospirales bacterium]